MQKTGSGSLITVESEHVHECQNETPVHTPHTIIHAYSKTLKIGTLGFMRYSLIENTRVNGIQISGRSWIKSTRMLQVCAPCVNLISLCYFHLRRPKSKETHDACL